MKTHKIGQAKNTRKLSDAVIEKRYLDLQKLRDAVKTAEMSCAGQTLKKPEHRTAAELVVSPGQSVRPNFGGQR